jgi:TalC/MipB family fructose-6-phosphate aldolase
MLLIDSANAGEVAQAVHAGLVTGATMNPALIAAQAPALPLDVLRAVLDACDGAVFYQPTAPDPADAEREAETAIGLAAPRLVVKLASTLPYVALARRLVNRGAAVALTAVYSPAQALVAVSLGCQWVIPYVDRAARLMPTDPPVVSALSAVLRNGRSVPRDGDSQQGGNWPRILAASIKSPAQAVEAAVQGAHALTMPLTVLRELADHPLSHAAVEEFARAATRPAPSARSR